MWSGYIGADVSVKNMLKMPALTAEISEVNTAQDCMNAAQNPELVTALDQTITKWCKEIEKVRPNAGFQPEVLHFYSVLSSSWVAAWCSG